VEIETLLTGIGGQGIQLAARTLAESAMAEGREVMVFGSYGGMMRGGSTDATLVVGDGAIESPPTVTNAWSALLVHPEYAAPALGRVRRGGLILFNETLFAAPPADGAIGIPATALGGAPVNASLVLVGAYLAISGLVTLDAALAAVGDALPPYRRQHAEGCREALRTGHAAAPDARVAAWAA